MEAAQQLGLVWRVSYEAPPHGAGGLCYHGGRERTLTAMTPTRHYNLALLGFGNVGRALAGLLGRKRDELRERYGVEWTITGVASRRLGWQADPAGLQLESLQAAAAAAVPRPDETIPVLPSIGPGAAGFQEWLAASQANVLFENTSMNPHTGQPALDYLRSALDGGVHVVTANKGPVVHGYRELRDLAAQKGVRFLFEATVMGGAPLFSLFREALPAARLYRFRGILNSTTNLIITEMERGNAFEQAVKKAQGLGIAESDPSFDVDGWDAAVKVSALATVLMDTPTLPAQVERQGIEAFTPALVREAREEGRRWKLICQAERGEAGVRTKVAPQLLTPDDPLYAVMGTSSSITFVSDVLGPLTVTEDNAGPETTAYGLLADFIHAVGTKPER